MSFNTNASQSSQDLTILGMPMAEAQASYFRRTGETVRIRLPRAKRAPQIRGPSGNPVVPWIPESSVRSGAPEEDPDVQFLMEVRRNEDSGIPPVKKQRMDLSTGGMEPLPSSGIPEDDKENRNLPVAPKIKGFRIKDILGIPDDNSGNTRIVLSPPVVKKRRGHFSRGQMVILEAAFAKNAYWSAEESRAIAERCEEVDDPRGTKKATVVTVRTWCQHKRMKMRPAARKEPLGHGPPGNETNFQTL